MQADRPPSALPVPGDAGVPPWRPSRTMRLVLSLAARLRVGTLTVIGPDGSVRCFAGPIPGPAATVRVHRDRIARRFLIGGMLSFCEGYLDGDWDSPDTATLFELTLRNRDAFGPVLEGMRWFQMVQNWLHRLRPNTTRGSRRNIAAHYDLGNEFYARWLDPSLTYSCALFADPAADEDLETAQRRKYQALAERLALAPDHHVLEIGCGWGGFAEYAAREVGARVTGITISRAQYDYASERLQKAGLGERARIELVDYRNVEGRFDRIASIEMFEAVGEAYWPTFFACLRDRLIAGGRAALQVITIADHLYDGYRKSADYIQRYVFPGGMLPSPSVLTKEITRADLTVREAAPFGQHYARTLALWRRRFTAAWPELSRLGFDQRFRRVWEQYLCYCEAGFRTGSIDVVQVGVGRP